MAAGLTVAMAACGGQETEPVPEPAPAPAPAPAPSPTPGGDPTITVSPQSGTTRTHVTVQGSGFEPNSRVRIGFGPPQSEYELFARTSADSRGRISTTVNVPNWAESGRDYLFVGVGPGNEEAISARFHVSAGDAGDGDGEEAVTVTGVLTGEGVECPALRTDEDKLYTLAGDTGRFEEGDRVRVEGTIAEMSYCMQGTTIEVEDISDAS